MFSVGRPEIWQSAVHSTSVWIFTFVLAVIIPILDYVMYSRLKSTLQIYVWNIVALWTLSAGCAWVSRTNHLTLSDLGENTGHSLRTLIVFGIVVALVILLVLAGKKQKSKASSAKMNKALERVRRLIPKSSTERAAWIVVAISAGVCEEFLYRGWLLSLFGAALGSVWLGLLISSIIFGFAHAYQGRNAIVSTGVVGVVFGVVFIVSGILIPGQVLHAAMDLNNGLALGRTAEREGV